MRIPDCIGMVLSLIASIIGAQMEEGLQFLTITKPVNSLPHQFSSMYPLVKMW
jgi:hypothetical protein